MSSAILNAFRRQIDLFAAQAKESLDGAHSSGGYEAMGPDDLNEYIELALSLFDGLVRRSHAIQERLARGELAYEPSMSRAFIEAFEAWLEPCDTIEAAIRSFQRRNVPIAGADRLGECAGKVRLIDSDVDGILEAVSNMRAGRGKPLKEAIDAVRGSG